MGLAVGGGGMGGGRNSWLSMYIGYFSDQKVSGNKYEWGDDTGLCLSGFLEAGV